MTDIEKRIKQIHEELNDISNFMSADENQGYGFSLGQAEDREKELYRELEELKIKSKS